MVAVLCCCGVLYRQKVDALTHVTQNVLTPFCCCLCFSTALSNSCTLGHRIAPLWQPQALWATSPHTSTQRDIHWQHVSHNINTALSLTRTPTSSSNFNLHHAHKRQSTTCILLWMCLWHCEVFTRPAGGACQLRLLPPAAKKKPTHHAHHPKLLINAMHTLNL